MVPITNSILANTRPHSVQAVSFRNESNYRANLTGFADRHSNSKHLIPSICYVCKENVSIMERQNVMHLVIHTNCFQCSDCKRRLDPSSYEHILDNITRKCKLNVINSQLYDYDFQKCSFYLRCVLLYSSQAAC